MSPLEWVGAICCGLVALGIAGAGIGWAADRIGAAFWKRRERLDGLAVRKLGGELLSASHWFSEDKPTAFLLNKMASDIAIYGCLQSTSQVRDDWRRERFKEAKS